MGTVDWTEQGGRRLLEQHDGRAPEPNTTGGSQVAKANAGSDKRAPSLHGQCAAIDGQVTTTAGPNQTSSAHEHTPQQRATKRVSATMGERPTTAPGEPRDGGSESKHDNARAQDAETGDATTDVARSEDDGGATMKVKEEANQDSALSDAAATSGQKPTATETVQNGTTGEEAKQRNESKLDPCQQLTLEEVFELLRVDGDDEQNAGWSRLAQENCIHVHHDLQLNRDHKNTGQGEKLLTSLGRQ